MRCSALSAPGDRDALVAENSFVLLQSVCKSRENNRFPVRGDNITDPLFHGAVLGLVESNPDLGETGKEVLVVRPGRIRCSEPLSE